MQKLDWKNGIWAKYGLENRICIAPSGTSNKCMNYNKTNFDGLLIGH